MQKFFKHLNHIFHRITSVGLKFFTSPFLIVSIIEVWIDNNERNGYKRTQDYTRPRSGSETNHNEQSTNPKTWILTK